MKFYWLRTTNKKRQVIWRGFKLKRDMKEYARLNAITIQAKNWHCGNEPPQLSHSKK